MLSAKDRTKYEQNKPNLQKEVVVSYGESRMEGRVKFGLVSRFCHAVRCRSPANAKTLNA